jgi:hypothetical protein
MTRRIASGIIMFAIIYLATGCAVRGGAISEGKAYQIGKAISLPLPEEDVRTMLEAGIAPANYRMDLRKSGGSEWRYFYHEPGESSDELDKIGIRVYAQIESLADRLPELSLGDLVASFGSPTKVTVVRSQKRRLLEAEYADVAFRFGEDADQAKEIRLSDEGPYRPASPFLYKQAIGIGSPSEDVFALFGEPAGSAHYKDAPSAADGIMQLCDATPGLAYIAYASEGAGFYFESGRVAAMHLFPRDSEPPQEQAPKGKEAASAALPEKALGAIKPYDDVRTKAFGPDAAGLDEETMRTLWYSSATAFPGEAGALADRVLDEGRNPGLGVRALHEEGLTGERVVVGIIDQNLPGLDHPEYVGKIAKYRDFGTGMKPESGSMHGPAVLSLLVGERAGTAPGARAYYAAVPAWTGDAKYYAKALDWMVDEDAKLPKGKGIRVVSVSAAPSGRGSPFTKNQDAWDAAVARASAKGILVLDCTREKGRIDACYLDPNAPDDLQKCLPGYPGTPGMPISKDRLLAPTSPRSTAEAYGPGGEAWQYTGRGGLSWGIPWTAGVLAMGWQLDPRLSSSEIIKLLEENAYRAQDGSRIIYPAAFIEAVKKGLR